jgi:hypothetical protein
MFQLFAKLQQSGQQLGSCPGAGRPRRGARALGRARTVCRRPWPRSA